MLFLLSLAFVPVLVKAQINVPDCLPAAFAVWNWTYNSLDQSPCATAGYLAAECNNGRFTIPQLTAGNHYTGPSNQSSNDMCQCNTVLYSLISACAGCQKGKWLSYDEWTANCKSRAAMSMFPQVIVNATRVPAWAFVNVTADQPWDNVTACAVGGTPESFGTFRPSWAPQYSKASALSTGAIAGAVAGATVVGLAALAAGMWYLVRRYRRRGTLKGNVKSPSITLTAHTGYESVPWTPQSDIKFYDPADPSTFPDLKAIPPKSATSARSFGSMSTAINTQASASPKPSRTTNYLGLPEV